MGGSEKIVEEAYPENVIPHKHLFSFFFSREIPPVPSQDERKVYPEENANILSRIFFWWLNPIMKVGYKRVLMPEDLFILPENLSVPFMTEKFKGNYKKIWNYRINLGRTKGGQRSEQVNVDRTVRYVCILALFKTFWKSIFLSCLYMALSQVGSTLNALVSKKLISFVDAKSPESGKGIGYAIATTAVICICGFLQNHSLQQAMMSGAKCKAVLTKAVLEKSFRLNSKSESEYPSGKIMSMLGGDLSRIDRSLMYLPVLVAFPFPVIVAIVVLLVNIGVAALVGIGLLFLFVLGLAYFTRRVIQLRRKANISTDKRVKYIQEILHNLRMIKFYSWEYPYYLQTAEARQKEMNVVLKIQALTNTLMAFSMSFSTFASMIAFLVLYGVKSNSMSPDDIFSSLSLFNMLSTIVYILPMALSTTADSLVSYHRTDEFLQSEESYVHETLQVSGLNKLTMDAKGLAIEVDKGYFLWYASGENKNKNDSSATEESDSSLVMESFSFDSNASQLMDINLKIRKGEFVVLTGVTGSGKTSLLNALAGFMNRNSGSIQVNGTLTFCGRPWIQNTSVRENILFGSTFNERRYREIIDKCSLVKDIEDLDAGDFTEIGERGITLSGGQKARISLARAVYTDRDIILLDDVLSAVDAKVGKYIVEQCILNLLKQKTRILATHQLSLIKWADKVIYMKENGSIDFGSLNEILEKNPDFSELMKLTVQDNKNEASEDNVVKPVEQSDMQLTKKSDRGTLMQKEGRAVDAIPWLVYKNYLKFGSGIFTPYGWPFMYLLTTSLAAFCQLFSNVWLSFWVNRSFDKLDNKSYIGVYVMFPLLTIIFTVGELLSIVYLINTSSLQLHIKALKNVLHSPMSFLDTNPIGRVLNRFSRDTEVLDNEMGNQARLTSYTLSSIIAILILCVVYLPWIAISYPILFIIFMAVVNYYQVSSREVKRLESVQRSHVYSSAGEILNGMDVLKAYGVEKLFSSKLDNLIDQMNEAYYVSLTNQRWLGVQITFIACFFVLVMAILCAMRIFNINASSVGLVLSYLIQVTNQVVQLIRALTQLENQLNSVERLDEYATKLEQEAPYDIKNSCPPDWPNEGEIEFSNVYMRYRKNVPLVLRDLTFKVDPKEKIGICGRTGAGKSSLIASLFRLSEIDSGEIFIDGINIASLGLQQLRSKLSIIPQDPVLFEGTLRRNLDPFNNYDDDYLLKALEKVGLSYTSNAEKPKSYDLLENKGKFDLNSRIKEDGSNYSLGEKQLISFVRALIGEKKILVLDEATSSVDYVSDAKIQRLIAEEFFNCTILCIAHRLKTILKYDRILVLEKGHVVEFDKPYNLYEKGGIFREMCDKSKISSSDFM